MVSHFFVGAAFLVCPILAQAQEKGGPGPNRPDEPLAKTFSLERAVVFLDAASLEWQKSRNCFTCHTNLAYMYARPLVSAEGKVHQHIRQELEKLVTERWQAKGPRWDAEVVAAAAALAFNDAHTTRKLHPTTRIALERMWTVQKEHGGWNWLKCAWPPMENDDHYGVTLAALAVGVAPEGYAKTENATRGLAGIKKYFAAHPPENAHHKAMLLWAASYLPDLVSQPKKKMYIEELLALQRPDGGWAGASLGRWKRGDKKEQDTTTSDGYGTGFTIYVLRRAGLPADHPALGQGIAWLKGHQRESGRWYSRSLFRDGRHYLTHAGTVFAVMALRSCE